MKFSVFTSILFLTACSQLPPKEGPAPVGLEALLSEQDLKIHRCLRSGKAAYSELKKSCLAGTPYEELLNRTPSADDNEVILKNNWFFDSSENIEKFYKASRGFIKGQARLMALGAGKLVEKKVIGVEGSAYFGVGLGWAAELGVHEHKLGLFCSPSWSLQTDVGVEGDLFLSRTLSCRNNSDYAGDDLSFGGSISGELTGLPAGVGLSYAMSINRQVFHEKISDARKRGLLNLQSLKAELSYLNSPEMKKALTGTHKNALSVLTLTLKPLALFHLSPPELISGQKVSALVRDLIRNDRSLSSAFKTYYTRTLRQELMARRLLNLNAFLGAIEGSVNGCDSISGSVSVGVSLVPASVGVSYSRTALLAEVGPPELATFKVTTPMALLNPFLLPSQDLRNIVKVARTLVAIPQNVQRLCLK